MAIVWGSTHSNGSAWQRIGIELTVSGTTITAKYYGDSNGTSGTWTLTRTGAITGTKSVSWSGSGVELLDTRTRSGSRGEEYTFGASYPRWWGGSMSVSGVEITVPALAPSTPVAPTISNITASSLRLNLASAPASNGAAITRYEWQLEGGSVINGTTTRNQTMSGLAANTSYRGRVRARNSAGVSSWSSYSASSSTLPTVPAAPGTPSVARVGDTQHTVTWTRNATTPAPYTTQNVQRSTWVDGAWTTMATISSVAGSATSFSDTTTIANRRYVYRIQAVNPAGTADSSNSASIATTPAAPTVITATRVGNDIQLTGTANDHHPSALYRYQDNVVDLSPATTSSLSRTHTAPNPAVTHTYRARTESESNTSNSSTLVSAWSAHSNTVQLQAPPAAPTGLSPSGGTVFSSDGSNLTLTWNHNPTDSSQQSAYNFQYRVNGGSWITTGKTTSTASSRSWTRVEGNIEWQVQTWGTHADAGPWSAIASFTVSPRPITTIEFPENGSDFDAGQVTIEWSYFQASSSPQNRWEATITDVDANVIIWSASADNADTSRTTARVLENTKDYLLSVRTRSGQLLWSDWDTSAFYVEFTPAPPPEITVGWDDAGFNQIVVTPVEEDAEPVAEYLYVQRQVGEGGPWEVIATNLPGDSPETNVNDWTSPITGHVAYCAVAVTDQGATSTSEEVVAFRTPYGRRAYIAAGEDYSACAYLQYEVKTKARTGRQRVQHQFAGRATAVEFSSNVINSAIEVSGVVLEHGTRVDTGLTSGTTSDEVEQVFALPGPHLYRDTMGRYMFCTVSEVDLEFGPFIKVAFSAERSTPPWSIVNDYGQGGDG